MDRSIGPRATAAPFVPVSRHFGDCAEVGGSKQTLRRWLLRAEQDAGERSGPTRSDADRLAALEREHRELKRAIDILRKASAFLAGAGCPLRELDRLTR